MQQHIDCVVVGAGVIGLAVARALARGGREVLILEHERQYGLHASSRNSEVLHAGIHYPSGSLKARLCVAGNELLWQYAQQRGFAVQRCGKLTVATHDAELAALERVADNARTNGVPSLEWLSAAQARRLEPELSCVAALATATSGIIDTHGYMQALLADAEACGATLVYGTPVQALETTADGIAVCLHAQPDAELLARCVVNAAGVRAAALARATQGLSSAWIPSVRYAKGSYFSLLGRAPFQRLIYPVPGAAGHLGVHLTLDLGGRARFGPDLEWLSEIAPSAYTVDPARAAPFYAAIRRYWPGIAPGSLLPGYAGIRATLAQPGGDVQDFCISGPAQHGIAGLVNLFGIDSPGLTASLPLADLVTEMLD